MLHNHHAVYPPIPITDIPGDDDVIIQNTETTNTIHRSNRSNSALSIAPMFNLTTNLLCHKTSQQAATVQQLPSTELCLRIVWLSDGPAPRRWSPVKVSMELWARHMGRHCVVDKIVTF